MTQDRFLKMLGDPNLLATISYQELKTLALAYPYAHNLRYLLALKAQQEHHPEFTTTLAAAAAHSLHRPQLFQLIMPQRLLVVEEVLELKAIEALQLELEARAPMPRQSEPAPAPAPQREQPRPETPPAASADEEEQPVQTAEPDIPVPTSLEPAAAAAPVILPFDQWLDQFNLPALAPRTKRTTPTVVKPIVDAPAPAALAGDTPLTPQMLAERSVSPKEDVMSETLARLFAAQGHREKAIALYERLRLALPEKSEYFAAEIDKLKK